jgi:hypothetical protein
MNISRTFKTLAQAERFQDKLYEKYNSVKLVRFPMFTEEGLYIWQVQ